MEPNVSDQNEIRLFDRVKELTYTQGTTDFALSGAAQGFSSLDRFYKHNETIFYAATDGIRYEIGSGIYKRADDDPEDEISYNQIERMPFRSSNPDNSIVNFPPGVKEVFITYPATHSVIMGSGVQGLNVPKRRGIAVWDSENILNYYPNLIFNPSLNAVGINQPIPIYGLDLGGNAQDYSSRVRASGYHVGPTGIHFQINNGANANLQLSEQPYAGGTQFVHFTPNLTDEQLPSEQQTNSNLIFNFAGDVNQYLLLKKQDAHTVFAGPIDDCQPSCESNYPSFRPLVLDDMPIQSLATVFASLDDLLATSGSLVNYTDSEVMASGNHILSEVSGVQHNLDAHVSGYNSDFRDLEIAISGKVDTYLHRADHESPYVTAYIDRSNQFSYQDNSDYWNDNQWGIVPFADIEYESNDSSWDTSFYWYDVPSSGRYNVQVNLSSFYDDDATNPSHGDSVYRLVTSGDGIARPSYADGYAIPANPLTINAGVSYISSNSVKSHSWNINVPSGHKIYLEYGGYLFNMSNISIHKI